MKQSHIAFIMLVVGAGLIGWAAGTVWQAIAMVVGVYLVGWSQIMDLIRDRNHRTSEGTFSGE